MSSHTPVRSGPTPQRQIAQKQVTINPTITTISTVKTKKDSKAEPPKADLFGVPSSSSVAIVTSTPEYTGGASVTDAFFGVPENADSLPDLGQSKDITTDDILNQPSSQTLEAGSTEEELDAADTLLSLSTVRENLDFGIDDFEDNSLLMPIGGQPPIKDVAPEPLRLGQVEVDSEIARIITAKEQDQVVTPDTTALSGVPDEQPTMTTTAVEKSADNVVSLEANKEQPNDLDVQKEDAHKGARPKTKTQAGEGSKLETKKGSRGAFRSQLYGLKRRAPKDRSYRCWLCGVTKHSTESLNAHHRKWHEKLNCTVCGKVFDLDTSLKHHMYSHFP